MDRRQFLRCAAGAFTVSSLAAAVAGCKTGIGGGSDKEAGGSGLYRFPQGLACGDPSPTSGVFWTRVVRSDGVEGDIPVTLELSRTPIAIGETSFRLATPIPLLAKQANDYIVHHKVTGLQSDTVYYYRFVVGGDYTRVGRFRALPSLDAEVSSTQFGMVNGLDWSRNYWEGMDLLKGQYQSLHYLVLQGGVINELVPPFSAERFVAPAHSALHLPDGMTVAGRGTAAATAADYRYLHQLYRSEENLQELLASFTLMPMLGDNDFSEDFWQAHETYTAANAEQRERLLAALATWMQYMPLDWGDVGYDPTVTDFSRFKLYRSFRWGNLVDLMLTEQRLQRTDHPIREDLPHQPLGQTGPIGSRALLAPAELAANSSAAHKLVGDEQMAWLKGKLQQKGVVWKLIAGESPMMHLPLDLTKEPDYDPALKKVHLLSGEAWEGYPAQLGELLTFIQSQNLNNVVSLASGNLFSASEIWSDYSGVRSPVMLECTTGPISGQAMAERIAELLALEPDGRFDRLQRLFAQSYLLDNLIKKDVVSWIRHLNTGSRGYSVVYVRADRLIVDLLKVQQMSTMAVPTQILASTTRITIDSGTLEIDVLELNS